MPSCAAFGCGNRSKANGRKVRTKEGVSLHRFPPNADQRKAWIVALRRDEWVPSSADRVCSEHFTENNFYVSEKGRRFLNAGAIPSIFPAFPKHLQKEESW